MAQNWRSVEQQHVADACALILADNKSYSRRAHRIFIKLNQDRVPAKAAMRLAYCLANDLPLDTKIKFSSGESTVLRLQQLGFEVETTKRRKVSQADDDADVAT